MATTGNDQIWATGADYQFIDAMEGDDIIHVASQSGSMGRVVEVDGGPGYDILHLSGFRTQGSVSAYAWQGFIQLHASNPSFVTDVSFRGIEEIRLAGETFTGATGDTRDVITLRGTGAQGSQRAVLSTNGGDDVISVIGLPEAVVRAGAGNDVVTFTDVHTSLSFISYSYIYGQGGNDILTGSGGRDSIDGGTGADDMTGGAGNDSFFVDDAGDRLFELEGGGDDFVQSSISWVLGDHFEDLTLTGGAAVDGTGNDLVNTLTGNAAANVLSGMGGDDKLDGRGGADTMRGGAGNDKYTVDDAGDRVVELAGEGRDTVMAYFSYVLPSNFENLHLYHWGPSNGTGNALDNEIYGNHAANVLRGGAGNDTLSGGGGRGDVLMGGIGNDTYFVSNRYDLLLEEGWGHDTVGSSISYTLGGGFEDLTLIGFLATSGTGNDLSNRITGGPNQTLLSGKGGDDVLDGGHGADRMDGGTGNDRYLVDNEADLVIELAGEGTDTVESSASFVLPDHVEALVLTGTVAVDGTGNGLANTLTGNAAANVLDGKQGGDFMFGGLGDDVYIVDQIGDKARETGGGGHDHVYSAVSFALEAGLEDLTLTGTGHIFGTGNDAANTLTGNSGNNRLSGGGGADAMAGGEGNDIYAVDHAGDVVVEAAGGGVDTVESDVSRSLEAEVEYLVLKGGANLDGTGNALANQIYGNSGANRLDGGGGADALFGGAGDDLYIVSDAGDRATEISATGGFDTVESAVSFSLGSNIEQLTLTGDSAVNGTGNGLANRVAGNDAANVLTGGLGADALSGGGGNDLFRYLSVADSTEAVRDSILDFTSGDRIDLSAIDTNRATGGDEAFTWRGAGAFTGTAGEVRAWQTGGAWVVQADLDGDASADLTIGVTTTGGHMLTAADFVL